jgi:hypothetical protein
MTEKTNSYGRTVAICDHADSVGFLLAGDGEPPRIDAWLALTPPAGKALAERGIDYLVLDDFFEEADLLGSIDDRLDFQVEWAVWLDRYIQSKILPFEQVNFTPALAFFYQIKNFFDRLTVHRFSLEAFLAGYRPAKIIWMSTHKSIMRERHAMGLHYVDQILPVLVRDRDIELTTLKLPNDDAASLFKALENYSREIRSFLKEEARDFLARARIQVQGWRLSKSQKKHLQQSRLSKTNILVLQNTYDIYYVLPHLVAAGVSTRYPSLNRIAAHSKKINNGEIKASLHKVWIEIIKEPRFWALLEGWLEGKEIVKPWLERLWFHSFFEYWQGLQQSREFLKNNRSQGLVVANTLGLEPYSVGAGFLHGARLAGIPIFSVLHGTAPGYCLHPIMAPLDLPFADFYFAHGVGVAKYLHQVAERYPFRHAITLAGGSPRVDGTRNSFDPQRAVKLRQKLAESETRPLVLHIPDFLYYHRRLGGDAVSCMPYFELQKKIINLFIEFKNVRLVYRSFTGEWPDLMPGIVKQRVPNAIIARANIKLSDLIWAVDAIILDYPVTPLSDVLLTNKPLIVFSDKRYYKMFEPAKALLRKRATLVETPEEYLTAIREFLGKGDFEELAFPNNEFRRYYITDKDDGKAAARVADYILEVIATRRDQ